MEESPPEEEEAIIILEFLTIPSASGDMFFYLHKLTPCLPD